MMKISKYIFALLFFLAATLSAKLPVPVKRSITHHIIDQADVLSDQDETNLLAYLRAYHKEAGVTMGIVTVKNLEGEDVFSFGMRILENWKTKDLTPGDKETDRGLLYVFALHDRKTHLFTGQGMEGEIPDGVAGRIQHFLKPFYRAENYAGGMIDLVRSCARVSGIPNLQVEGLTPPEAGAQLPEKAKPQAPIDISLVIFLIVFFSIFIGVPIAIFTGNSRGGSSGGGSSSSSSGGFGGGGGGFSGGGAGGSW